MFEGFNCFTIFIFNLEACWSFEASAPDTGIFSKVMRVTNSLSTTSRAHRSRGFTWLIITRSQLWAATKLKLLSGSCSPAARLWTPRGAMPASRGRYRADSRRHQWRRSFRQCETVQPIIRSVRNVRAGGAREGEDKTSRRGRTSTSNRRVRRPQREG